MGIIPTIPKLNSSSDPTMLNGLPTSRKNRSLLRQTCPSELHDLICVGFGPASLSIAIALHETLASLERAINVPHEAAPSPKVCFLERQPSFSWHAGMLLPGATMQISFLKDMATLRNPCSEFTFLNYLHRQHRLVEFTNLNTFLPQRVEYEDYLRWCSAWFEDVVGYNQHVIGVWPELRSKENRETSSHGLDVEEPVSVFIVKSRDLRTDELMVRRTRHVVIATGGEPNFPAHFPQQHPRVIHSSQFSRIASDLQANHLHHWRIAIVGNGQSAAEIFDHLHNSLPNARTTLIIRRPALRPSDDSPFVNEIFNPSRVSSVYAQDPQLRASSIMADRSTNYGVVQLDLIERIYEMLYTQRIHMPNEDKWPCRILPHRELLRIDLNGTGDGLRLHLHNRSGEFLLGQAIGEESLDVDVVFLATGYVRDAHKEILKGCEKLNGGKDGKWEVGRDYQVKFSKGTVSDDAGVWLQGCCEETHGLSDTLLSVLAPRAGELVHSLFGDWGAPSESEGIPASKEFSRI